MNGVGLIRQERARQRRRSSNGEAYSLGHDDSHDRDELARAAAVYAMPERNRKDYGFPIWPYNWRFKRDERVRELVKAGALIAAEIDRLLRAEPAKEEA